MDSPDGAKPITLWERAAEVLTHPAVAFVQTFFLIKLILILIYQTFNYKFIKYYFKQ